MKKKTVSLFAMILFFAGLGCTGFSEDKSGLDHLRDFFEGRDPAKMDAAATEFQKDVDSDPEDYQAKIYAAFTKLLNLINDEELNTLMEQFGFRYEDAGGDEGWTITGDLVYEGAPPSNEVVDTVWERVQPALDEAIVLLAGIPDSWTGSAEVSPDYFPVDEVVYVDYADTVAARAMFKAAHSFMNTIRAYDLSVDYATIDWPVTLPVKQITVDGDPTDWEDVPVQLVGYEGDRTHQVKACTFNQTLYLLLEVEPLDEGDSFDIDGKVYIELDGNKETLSFYVQSWDGEVFAGYDVVGMWDDVASVVMTNDIIELAIDVPVEAGTLTKGGVVDYVDYHHYAEDPWYFYGRSALEFPENHPVNEVMALLPDVLSSVRNEQALLSARDELSESIDLAQDATERIRNRPESHYHFFELDPEDDEEVDEMVAFLDDVQASLAGPLRFDVEDEEDEFRLTVHAGAFYEAPFGTRAMLPDYDTGTLWNNPVRDSFPDPTFGGVLPNMTQADITRLLDNQGFDEQPFSYQRDGDDVTLTGHTGDEYDLHLPLEIDGRPVTRIGDEAFAGRTDISSVLFGRHVSHLGASAFAGCTSIHALYFTGDAPQVGEDAFHNVDARLYRRFGTQGWGDSLEGLPVDLWRAVIASGESLGPDASGFRFRFSGPPEDTAVVEVSDNLIGGEWIPVYTNVLGAGESEFSDEQWIDHLNRYYRVKLIYE